MIHLKRVAAVVVFALAMFAFAIDGAPAHHIDKSKGACDNPIDQKFAEAFAEIRKHYDLPAEPYCKLDKNNLDPRLTPNLIIGI